MKWFIQDTDEINRYSLTADGELVLTASFEELQEYLKQHMKGGDTLREQYGDYLIPFTYDHEVMKRQWRNDKC